MEQPLDIKTCHCDYCHEDLSNEEWNSHWDTHVHHYKTADCSCGKKKWLKVDFVGSGDDNHIEGSSSLESTLRKVSER